MEKKKILVIGGGFGGVFAAKELARRGRDEFDIELINTKDPVPLGMGEVTAGPTAGAIGNAVSHALGTRLRDLPLTRERIMAALLKD